MGAKERLAQLMEETGLTNQSELARRLDPPEAPTWINNRLTGYSAIKADELPRLADALGIPVSAFFEDPASHRADSPARLLPVLADMGYDVTPLERDTLVEMADVLARYRKRVLDEQTG